VELGLRGRFPPSYFYSAVDCVISLVRVRVRVSVRVLG